jgi:hypothetical protein
MNNRFRGTRRHRFEDVYKQMTKFEFHEAQQSHEYNVGKVQRGYYSADPDGKVEKVIDRVMTQHMVDGTKEDSLEPEPTDETLKYLPSLELSDPIIAAMLKVCKVEQVKGFEMLDSRWNGNEGTNHPNHHTDRITPRSVQIWYSQGQPVCEAESSRGRVRVHERGALAHLAPKDRDRSRAQSPAHWPAPQGKNISFSLDVDLHFVV